VKDIYFERLPVQIPEHFASPVKIQLSEIQQEYYTQTLIDPFGQYP
jgi:hypothetical protein